MSKEQNQTVSASQSADVASAVDVVDAIAVDGSVLDHVRLLNEPRGWLDRIADFGGRVCSSILVKEARQAMSSRQFLWTYLALLAVCAFWAIGGLAFNLNTSESGPIMLFGFYMIVGVPLAIIVPFSAYRSLVREYEDGTIQLVSITTMRPYQIVAGKLGSAMLQMLIYLSILAPCIAFTYLLRGIGINQVLIGLAVSIFGCVFLTNLGLFLAGTTRSGLLNVGVSVLLIACLIMVYVWWIAIAGAITQSQAWMDEDFWESESAAILFGVIAFFASTGLLLFVSASAQISFPTENRTTAVRIVLLVQQVLCFAWLTAVVAVNPGNGRFEEEIAIVMMFVVGHYWLLMGFLMSSEAWPLSDRVRRQLPTAWLSRTFTSLLLPGPGRGFLFASANVIAGALFLILLATFGFEPGNWGSAVVLAGVTLGGGVMDAAIGCLFSCVYILAFLAVLYLAMTYRRRRWPSVGVSQYNPIISLVIGVALVLTATFVGLILQFSGVGLTGQFDNDYTLLQMFNWHWTTIELIDSGGSQSLAFAGASMFTCLALPIIAVAFAVASRELLIDPAATPDEVLAQHARPKQIQTAEGESIAEIFGDIDHDSQQIDR